MPELKTGDGQTSSQMSALAAEKTARIAAIDAEISELNTQMSRSVRVDAAWHEAYQRVKVLKGERATLAREVSNLKQGGSDVNAQSGLVKQDKKDRKAVDAVTGDRTQAIVDVNDSRSTFGDFRTEAHNRALGNGPSMAGVAARQQSQRTVGMGQALLAGGTPGQQQAGALQQVLQQSSKAHSAIAENAAVGASSEQLKALGQFGDASQQMRAQAIERRGAVIEAQFGILDIEQRDRVLLAAAQSFNQTFEEMRRQYDDALARGDKEAAYRMISAGITATATIASTLITPKKAKKE